LKLTYSIPGAVALQRELGDLRSSEPHYVVWTSKALLQRTDSTTSASFPCTIDNHALLASFAGANRFLDRADELAQGAIE
jgi:hypothetical protein